MRALVNGGDDAVRKEPPKLEKIHFLQKIQEPPQSQRLWFQKVLAKHALNAQPRFAEERLGLAPRELADVVFLQTGDALKMLHGPIGS